MRKTAVTNCATITFLPIVLYKTIDFRWKDTLIDTALFVKDITRDVGSILLTRNKTRTGECIPVRSYNKSTRVNKASIFLLANSKKSHGNLILD